MGRLLSKTDALNGTIQFNAIVERDFSLSGHLLKISSHAGGQLAIDAEYELDALGRRLKVTREGGGFWNYGYNDRSEVSSASRQFADATPMPMEQFQYTYDGIGNRLEAVAAGRVETYTPNELNQIVNHTHNGRLVVAGEADPEAAVAVQAQQAVKAQRKGNQFWAETVVDNAAGAVYLPVDVYAAKPGAGPGGQDLVAKESGKKFVPAAQVVLQYDMDGNLTADSRWTYGWDAENRLAWMEELPNATLGQAGLARRRLEFGYDALGRRWSKRVLNWNAGGSTWDLQRRTVMLWDGWNLVAELESPTEAGTPVMKRGYVWGLDVGDSLTASGGVGALVFEREHGPTGTLVATWTPLYDGNGNVLALMNAQNGSIGARYEYDAFGGVLRATGSKAEWNPIRFSTKFEDVESGLVYYGFRYYDPVAGRWPSRDPIGEQGGINLYGMVGNDAVNRVDYLGLWKIKRNSREKRTTAYPERGDTIRSLAAAVHLDVDEFRSWTGGWGEQYDGALTIL